MRKINFLMLCIAFAGRVYASSNNGLPFFDNEFDYLFNGNNNYLRFLRDNTVSLDGSDAILFSPGVISRTNAPQLNPLDFIRLTYYINENDARMGVEPQVAVVVRLPFSPTVAGEGNNSADNIFGRNNLTREISALEWSGVVEAGVSTYVFNDDAINGIKSNNSQYRHPISLHIDRTSSTGPIMEFLLRRDVERTGEEGENNAILSFMSCLRRYDRTDIITRLRDLGFFERR